MNNDSIDCHYWILFSYRFGVFRVMRHVGCIVLYELGRFLALSSDGEREIVELVKLVGFAKPN